MRQAGSERGFTHISSHSVAGPRDQLSGGVARCVVLRERQRPQGPHARTHGFFPECARPVQSEVFHTDPLAHGRPPRPCTTPVHVTLQAARAPKASQDGQGQPGRHSSRASQGGSTADPHGPRLRGRTATGSQGQPTAAKSSQRRPRPANGSQGHTKAATGAGQPTAAKGSQRQPRAATAPEGSQGSQGQPQAARRSQGQPRAATAPEGSQASQRQPGHPTAPQRQQPLVHTRGRP